MKKSKLIQAVRDVIKELSTTSGAGGYLTPNAFSKDGRKNKATKQMEKLGYKKAKTKKRPNNTKMFDYLDENN